MGVGSQHLKALWGPQHRLGKHYGLSPKVFSYFRVKVDNPDSLAVSSMGTRLGGTKPDSRYDQFG